MNTPIKDFSMDAYPKGTMTQGFGLNPKLYAPLGLNGHNGQDHVAPHGSPMYAIEAGTVLEVKYSPTGYGRHLRFISSECDAQGRYREWTYGHCDKIYVSVGDTIFAGQTIATMGNTGFVVSGSTPFWKLNPYAGTHLHLGLRLLVKPKRGGWTYPQSLIRVDVVNYGNGYKGSIDPTPYLTPVSPTVTPSLAQLQLTILSLQNTLKALLANK